MLLPMLAQAAQLLVPVLLPAAGDSVGLSLRAVCGATAPAWHVATSADGPVVAVSGRGTAGWADLRLDGPIVGPVSLRWSWRCSIHPAGAALHQRARDDAPLRVVVGFGGTPGKPSRAIAYTWGNTEPMGLRRRSHQSGRIHVIVVATAAEVDGTWRDVEVFPTADFEAIWGRAPEPITAIALLQDVEDTGEQAVASIRGMAAMRDLR
jgi:hypothetical protein